MEHRDCPHRYRMGIDIGGTFTDVVLHSEPVFSLVCLSGKTNKNHFL
ncbi:MAG: hypothetical protein JRH18_02480 [Deltaproteobacteria bacterium]|nr:hypothetical protein [Deltaproteobacteria bacterium]MBW1961068.1 hypothetical protein [Deltaproteobacteria bacterium]MBW2150515.1 hypothetical protein [Deltaproteobacteria bacterium]